MNTTMKRTVLALAIAAASASAGANGWGNDRDNQNQSANINHLHNVTETRTHNNTDNNTETNTLTDSRTWNRTRNTSTNTNSNSNTTVNSNVTRNRNVNINEHSNIQADERKEKNNHGVDVNLEKDLRLSSDVNFSGDPEITGELEVNSAAIAIIDNRQSVTNNEGSNSLLDNNASISENTGQDASGNLGFNVAAGDNNAQDNAASLSAADASFTFGMSDAEVFVNQYGAGNTTMNEGVVNNASLSGNAFRGASGNIGVNTAAGNNNEQKNALAASVSTARMAQSSISSNQVSTGNSVNNEGYMRAMSDTTEVTMRGRVAGGTLAIGGGVYQGRGNAYQKDNYYLDSWSGELPHPGGNSTGHLDMDSDIQNATANPYNEGVGGVAFDTDEEGRLGFIEVGAADLYASLSGTVRTTRWVNVNAENNASLSGNAFRGATGNIGVNVASGSGNLQANSLALAVAQPATGGGGGGGGTGE